MKKISTIFISLMLIMSIFMTGTAFGAEQSEVAEQSLSAVWSAPEVPAVESVTDAIAEIPQPVAETTEAYVLDQNNEPGIHRYIGHFTITHYCICARCCGKSASNAAYGRTATGTMATPGRTIAVDPRKIPYGTEVVINDQIYVAEDCGGGIKHNKIDILVSSHSEAIRKGVLRNVAVYVVEA